MLFIYSPYTVVYLSLGSQHPITTNNTEILITDIGEEGVGDPPSLTCHTDLRNCCRNIDTGQGGRGAWYYPDGTMVQRKAPEEQFYIQRNAEMLIKLNHRLDSTTLRPTGSYCCVIPTTRGEMTFCANIGECVHCMQRYMTVCSTPSLQSCVHPSLLWPMAQSPTLTQHWVRVV